MLVECGLVRVTLSGAAPRSARWWHRGRRPQADRVFTFRPSFGRIAALADPEGIVRLFARLHQPAAENAAAEVLIGLCDDDDVSPVVGEPEATPAGIRWRGGAIPPAQRVILARHLMTHGIVGTARPTAHRSGSYSARFDAADFVAAARVHLGMSSEDAEALSMSEFQRQMRMKFPEAAARELPTKAEYDAAMKRFERARGG